MWPAVVRAFVLAGSLLSPGMDGEVKAGDKKKLTVIVDFDEWLPDDPEKRSRVLSLLRTQLDKEWGQDVTYEGKTVRGLEIVVEEGKVDPRNKDPKRKKGEIGLKLPKIPPAGKEKWWGSHPRGSDMAWVYPTNIEKDPWAAGDYIMMIEKTLVHELGHMFCSNHDKTGVSKMAKLHRLVKKATGKKLDDTPGEVDISNFTLHMHNSTFSTKDRIKHLENLNEWLSKGGSMCDPPLEDESQVRATYPVQDELPDYEVEFGTIDFAITPGGDWRGYNLGFENPGDDNVMGTADDWVTLKWLGDLDFDGDGLPDDEPDTVLTLFRDRGYQFAAVDAISGRAYALGDYGVMVYSQGSFNATWALPVWENLDLRFDVDRDGTVDLSYLLSTDLSGILAEDGTPAFYPNRLGTGFSPRNPIPEPVTMGGMFLGVAALGAYLRKRRQV